MYRFIVVRPAVFQPGQPGAATQNPQHMSPPTAISKCKNFFSTLIRLASQQGEQTSMNVNNLIQGLVDDTMRPEDFTTNLQKELNSAEQPCLVPFLKRSLPYLRYSLMHDEMTIEGIRRPPPTAFALPNNPAPGVAPQPPNSVHSPMNSVQMPLQTAPLQPTIPSQSPNGPRIVRVVQPGQALMSGQQLITNLQPPTSGAQQIMMNTGIGGGNIVMNLPPGMQPGPGMMNASPGLMALPPGAAPPPGMQAGPNLIGQAQNMLSLPPPPGCPPAPITLPGQPRPTLPMNPLANNLANNAANRLPLQQPGLPRPPGPMNPGILNPTRLPHLPPQPGTESPLSMAIPGGKIPPKTVPTPKPKAPPKPKAKLKKDPMPLDTTASKSSSFKDDDDYNDVAAMGGVNLIEESQKMATTSELIGQQIRSCKDETFLPASSLHQRVHEIMKRFELTDCSPDVVTLLSHAVQERMKTVVQRLSCIAEHRQENLKMHNKYHVVQDIKGQVSFLAEMDKIEKKKHQEQERETLIKAAKSRSKVDDPDQAAMKARAKEMQRQELEEIRQKEANETALRAIGKKRPANFTPGSAPTTGVLSSASLNSSTGSGTGGGLTLSNTSSFTNSSKSNNSNAAPMKKIKRVTIRDVHFLMEHDRDTIRSITLYKALSK